MFTFDPLPYPTEIPLWCMTHEWVYQGKILTYKWNSATGNIAKGANERGNFPGTEKNGKTFRGFDKFRIIQNIWSVFQESKHCNCLCIDEELLEQLTLLRWQAFSCSAEVQSLSWVWIESQFLKIKAWTLLRTSREFRRRIFLQIGPFKSFKI